MTLLDTRDMNKVPEIGDRGFNLGEYFDPWLFGIIDAKHDPKKMKCTPYCKAGDAEDFLFGSVNWIWKSDIEAAMVKVIDNRLGIKPELEARPQNHRKIVFLYFCMANDRIWLAEHNVNLTRKYPNSEERDIQVEGIGNAVSRLTRKSMCKATELFSYLGVPTSHEHNGGNDSAFELQAWLAGLCLTPTQRSALYSGTPIRPYLPRVWAPEFSWATDSLLAAPQDLVVSASSLATLPTVTTPSTTASLMVSPSLTSRTTPSLLNTSGTGRTSFSSSTPPSNSQWTISMQTIHGISDMVSAKNSAIQAASRKL